MMLFHTVAKICIQGFVWYAFNVFWIFIAHVMPFLIVLCGMTNLNIYQYNFLVQSGSTMILKLPSVNN